MTPERIFHRVEANGRRVTVAYRRTSDGKIEYGATIYRADESGVPWRKKSAVSTARARLSASAVVVPDIEVEHSSHRDDYVRRMMHVHGVSA